MAIGWARDGDYSIEELLDTIPEEDKQHVRIDAASQLHNRGYKPFVRHKFSVSALGSESTTHIQSVPASTTARHRIRLSTELNQFGQDILDAEYEINTRLHLVPSGLEYRAARKACTVRHSKGDERMRRIRWNLANTGYEYSQEQKVLLEEFIKSLVPIIYKEEYESDPVSVLRKYDLEKPRRGVCVNAGRRTGKSKAISCFLAALIPEVPGFVMGVVSTGNRAGSGIRTYFMRILKNMKMKNRIVGMNNEEIIFWPRELPPSFKPRSDEARRMQYDPSCSRLKLFPNNPDGIRGSEMHSVVVEEAAYVNADMFTRVIVPYFLLRNFVMLAISSAQDPTNWYMELLARRHFRSVNFGQACDKCVLEGRSKNCPHSKVSIPHWMTKANKSFVSELISDPREYAQEVLGLSVGGPKRIFAEDLIQAFFRNPPIVIDQLRPRPEMCYVFMDPAGGGPSSEFAIVSMIRANEGYVVRTMYEMRCTKMKSTKVLASGTPSNCRPIAIASNISCINFTRSSKSLDSWWFCLASSWHRLLPPEIRFRRINCRARRINSFQAAPLPRSD